MRLNFDEQLDELRRELALMGALCEEAIAASAQAALTGGAEEPRKKASQLEEQTDRQEREIESLCMSLLLRQQPVARDLRVVSSALKMVSDMERIGDQASDIAELSPYQVTKTLMDAAGPQCRFMHCLPSYHDLKTKVGRETGEKFGRDSMEVSDEVFESGQSIVFDEAENRMHTIKAVMAELL